MGRRPIAREHAAAARSPSQRRLRVGEELRHVLSRLLTPGELRDPALREASITVSEVRMSADLRNATVFVMPLGGAHAAEIIEGLARSAAFLKRRAARRLGLRHMPDLTFALDDAFDRAERIAALLASPAVERDLAPQPTGDDDAQ